jgi:glycosyltransferase involved in cell wall biosynthesis
LESLRHQDNPFNLAVMDGGSTDNFDKVVRAYSDIITYLRSGPDDGQAAAIREGKETVHGDIVAWLNADDYYFPGALEEVAACFDSDPELDVVYGDAVHVSPEGFFLSYFPPIRSFDANDLTKICFICQPACFVRRSAYERAGRINPTLQYTMDWDLWCKLALNGARFKYIHELLAAVRYYPETKTLSGDWCRYREIWRIERKYGHRLLPLSWPGFYFYDLSFRKENNVYDRSILSILDFARGFKRKLLKSRRRGKELNRPLYGFHRREPVVEGSCTIHVPWYDLREWKKLYIRVEPADHGYRILVNGRNCRYEVSEGAYLAVQIPQIGGPDRRISIERNGKEKWRFLRFFLDFN